MLIQDEKLGEWVEKLNVCLTVIADQIRADPPDRDKIGDEVYEARVILSDMERVRKRYANAQR